MKFTFNEYVMIREAVEAHHQTMMAWTEARQSTPQERATARTKLVTLNSILDKFNDDAE